MSTKHVERRVTPPKIQIPQSPAALKAFASQLLKSHLQLIEQHNRLDDQVREALRGGISAENNSKQVLKEVTLTMPADAPWVDATLLNGFLNTGGSYPPLQYLMEPGGHASIRGRVDTGASGTIAATLPTGYASPYDERRAIEAGGHGSVIVYSTGDVVPVGGGPTFDVYASWIATNAAPPHVFTGAMWPLVVQHGLKELTSCEVLSAFDLTTGARASNGAAVADAEDLGDGSLRLNAVWGLQWGRKYKLLLRLSSEK